MVNIFARKNCRMSDFVFFTSCEYCCLRMCMALEASKRERERVHAFGVESLKHTDTRCVGELDCASVFFASTWINVPFK